MILTALLAGSLGACSTTKHEGSQKQTPSIKKSTRTNPAKKSRQPFRLKRDKDRVLLYAEFDANRRSPIQVNLVFIHNKYLISLISQLDAQQWFDQGDAISRKYSNSISVVSNKVLPSARTYLKRFTKRQKQAAMIVVFSSYRSNGEHKVIIKPKDINYVYFMKNHFIAK